MENNKSYLSSFFLCATKKSKGIGLFVLLFFLNFNTVQANEYSKEILLDPVNKFDEVPVEILVKGYLNFEANVIITDKNSVYINVEELFRKLGIYCVSENNGNQLKGFIENEKTPYVIDFDLKQINKGDKSVKSVNGIIKEMGAIYVETTVINEVFGLNMVFNFRSLSIKLDSEFELPLVKQARLEKMRQNISKLQSKSDVVIDTIIGRKYHLFKGGTMDWAVNSFQAQAEKINNSFSIGLGSELLYGDATIRFNYFEQTKFDSRQLYYNWRWIDNDNKFVKQVQLGRIGVQSIALIRGPVVGASFTNSPNTVRKATGTYTINDYTDPNWTVELYINDALVDYTQADASGLYVFKVPIVYGYTKLKLRFYGPLGEERIEEKTMNTPYTFMPTNILEYKVSGGIVDDGNGTTMGRGEFNYGLNRRITIGGGLEYLSNIVNNPLIPFANLSIQPFSKMVVNMKYAYDVSFTGLVNYYLGQRTFLELDYSKYVDGQKAVLNNANEERKLSLTLPYKLAIISGNAKLSFNQYVYDVFNFNQFDAVLSARYKNYSSNISLASNWIDTQSPFMTSTIVVSRKLANGLIFRPSLQYNITDNKMMRTRAEVEKRVLKMSYSASYERNFQFATDNVFLNFKYDLSFARTAIATTYNNKQISVSETAQGSIAFGAGNGVVKTGNNSALGKGGILFYPFIDLNRNGKWDKGEKKVLLSKIRVSGGKAVTSEKDSIVRVSDLNAFINYDIEFSESELDNISWRFKNKTFQVLIDPNQYKKIEVPILVMGEVNGKVFLKSDNVINGQDRITVQIFDAKGQKVAETQTESDGYYSYLGLNPGKFSIRIDDEQLKKLGYQSMPKTHVVQIKIEEDGTVLQGLDFEISAATQSINSSAEVVIPTNSNLDFSPEKASPKKASNKILKEGKVQQSVKKSGNGSLDILNRYSKETNGKIYGKVHTKIASSTNGISGVKVQLYNLDKVKVSEVVTNENGGYSFSGLIPGDYSVRLDENELEKLGYQSKTKLHNVVVLTAVVGDIIDNLDFEIILIDKNSKDSINQTDFKNNKSTSNSETPSPEKGNNTSNIILEKKNILEEKINKAFSAISQEKGAFYSIQIGVFKNIVNPKQLLNLSPVYYEILSSDQTRYLAGKFDLLSKAKEAKSSIVSKGIKDAYVVAYRDGAKIERVQLDSIKKHPKNKYRNIHGLVQLNNKNKIQGISGISVQVWSLDGVKISEVNTNDKGNYSFTGIKSGKYIVRMNEEQLEKLGCQATPKIYTINSTSPLETNSTQGLDFVLDKIK